MIKLFASLLLIVFCSSLLQAQQLNQKMKVDTLYESSKINPEVDKAYLHVSSQVPNLRFDSNRKIDRTDQTSSGDWNVWLPGGTHILKIDADGFQRLEMPPSNFAKKRSYELKIVAVGFAPAERADETLIEIAFQLNTDSVYSCYGNFAPTMALSRSISYSLPKGNYKFRFLKNGYEEQTMDIALIEPGNRTVTLRQSETRRANLALPGIIIITSQPSGAEIILNGQMLGATPYQDMLTAGNHQLEIRKSLYHSDVTSFTLKGGETKSIGRALKPRFGNVDVVDQPENTTIYIDGKLMGAAPILNQTLESGTHLIRFVNPMYHDTTLTIEIKDGEKRAMNLKLRPAFGQLNIATQPVSEAVVYIDNKKVGVTPYVNQQLSSGTYLVRVEKELYSIFEERITVNDGATAARDLTLTPNYGTVTIRADNSDILLNGKKVSTDKFTANLPSGRYQIAATRGDSYKDDSKDLVLKRGENISFELQPTAKMGSVTILVEPYDSIRAVIYVDGVPKGRAPLVLPLIVGQHTITVTKDYYADETKPITMAENQNQKLTITMETLETRRRRGATRKQALEQAALNEKPTYAPLPPGTYRFGARLGLNFAAADISPLGDDAEVNSKIGFMAGAILESNLSDNIFFQIEPMYSEGGIFYSTANSSLDLAYNISYLEIPVLLRFRLGGSNAISYFLAGPNLGVLLSSKFMTENMVYEESDPTVTPPGANSELSSVNFALDIGAGIEVRRSESSSVLLEVRYSMGLTNIINTIYPELSWQTRNIKFTLGVLF